MTSLRYLGFKDGFLKVHHSLYLRDVLGMRLRDAKHFTDAVLAGEHPVLEVPSEGADIHVRALGVLGAQVEVLAPLAVGAAA